MSKPGPIRITKADTGAGFAVDRTREDDPVRWLTDDLVRPKAEGAPIIDWRLAKPALHL